MSTKEPLRGKVARILNSTELVINLGSKDGVTVGMDFDVLDPKGEDIKDPDTGETLGSLQRPKVRVKIKSTQERLSVASTFRETQVNVGGRGPDWITPTVRLSDILLPPKYVNKQETLKTTEKTWEDLDEKESYVKTGDPVVQVTGQDVSLVTKKEKTGLSAS
ncbi:MAG TPA: hypothetical protein VJ875_04700 [Pyrinomonadaceae bacterium]|nr:hypothetical protein [Pyrinomonadaceae bacterium]